jgi:DNA-binding NarL/FixJ family response regulator
MMTAASPCRTYIVYRNALFAQGVRSVLERESGVQIVGMENDLTRATTALRALQPEVILMEEPTESGVTWPFLECAKASRIVTFSLNHAHATVYDPYRTAVGDPADLVRAIQGAGEPHIPGPDKSPGTGATADLLESGPNNIKRPSRGKVKGR